MGKYIEWFPGDFPANIKEKQALEKWPYVGVSKLRKWAVFTEKHHYIDLGLPSGTLWAEENIGTGRPEGYGNYYSWGETAIKDKYLWETYRHCDGTEDVLLKYNSSDQLTTLLAEDDAAVANWGSQWRMPTLDEQKELLDYCTWTHSTKNGVVGCTITGPNGNSIFLPASGFRIDTDFDSVGEIGGIWSSTLDESDMTYAYGVGFYTEQEPPGIYSTEDRYIGAPIRPVYIKPVSPTDPEEPEVDLTAPYVTFKAEEDNSSIGLEKLSSYQTLEYSIDASTWNTFDTTTNISLNNGDKIYVRGVLSDDNDVENHTQFKMGGKIASSGNCNAIWNYQDLNAPLKNYCGYCMFYECTSLTKAPALPATELTENCYDGMFDDCSSLITAPELPATTLAKSCYNGMFAGCTSLVAAPQLPATTLAASCYEYMFTGCTSLTTTPELPATELTESCYKDMFLNCTSLTTAPVLPATELAEGCYSGMFCFCTNLTAAPEVLPAMTLPPSCYYYMFRGCSSLTTAPQLHATTVASTCCFGMFLDCTSLTTAPELHAATLANLCYSAMFSGCTNLNYIKCLATDISADACTFDWVKGVASTGTFIKHPDMNDWEIDSIHGIPIGWTAINDGETPYVTFTAQENNSSIGLAQLSNKQTLEYSTDTTTWNTFDTTTNIPLNNGDKVYVRGMLSDKITITDFTQFKMTGKIAASGNCNAIWNYQDLNASLKERCGYRLFSDCSSLTTAPQLSAITLDPACYHQMFLNCTSLTAAPELPATTMANSCYQNMFEGCTSLATAPELPAMTLAYSCYEYMFEGCSSLTTAPELPATTLVKGCYRGIFRFCSSLTAAPELPATTLANDCYNAMFRGCSSLTTAPELPAMTLAEGCYKYMFTDCNSLHEIKCLATDISATNCTLEWVKGVAETGTFVKHPNMTSWPTGTAGVNGIPNGWTVVDAEI